MSSSAFAPVFPVPLYRLSTKSAKSPTRRLRTPRLSLDRPDENDQKIPKEASERPRLFVDDDSDSFWKSADVSRAFSPITEEEKAQLREILPERVAQFLIRRAEDAVAQRDRNHADSGFVSNFLKDLPPDVVDWEAKENAEYRDYVYESTGGAPAFRRRGSSLFGGGDGLPDKESKMMSLFVGNVNSVDEQASRVGYSLLTLVLAFFLLKLIWGLITFFVSFTFSFLAIFALGAGIFAVFFFLRF